jgi:hypothetical protein
MSEIKTEDINRLREALLEARQLLTVVQQSAVVERELQVRVDELVAANMELEALRAEARREQRAAEERCEDLEAQLHQRDAQIADLCAERADLLERLHGAGVKPSVPEPAPTPGGEPVTPHVLAWIERQGATVGGVAMVEAIELVQARDKFGRAKYGQGLQLPDGRDSFEDFVQEIGDGLQYGVKVLMEGATVDQVRQMRELTRLLWLLAHTEDLGVAP